MADSSLLNVNFDMQLVLSDWILGGANLIWSLQMSLVWLLHA